MGCRSSRRWPGRARPSRTAAPTSGSSTPSTAPSSTPARSLRSSTRRSASSASRCWSCRPCTSPMRRCCSGWWPTPGQAATCCCRFAAATRTSTPAPAGHGHLASCARRSAPATRSTATSPRRSACSGPAASPRRRRRVPPRGPTAWSWRALRRWRPTTTRTSAASPRPPPTGSARGGSPTSAPCPTPPSAGRSPSSRCSAWGFTYAGRTCPGRRLWFVSNWAWDPITVPTPVSGAALLSGRGVREGGSLELGAWDLDIVAEA
jgi:hypothetical protein